MRDNELENILIKQNILQGDKLQTAKEEARRTQQSLQSAIIKMGFTDEEELAGAVAEYSDLPYVDLDNYSIDRDVINYVPERLARRYDIMPVFKIGEALTVAVENPKDIIAIDEVRNATESQIIDLVVSTKSSIRRAVDRCYGVTGDMRSVVSEISAEQQEEDATAAGQTKEEEVFSSAEAPIIKLVNLLIRQAVKSRASDIHIEPDYDLLRVRIRVDGLLREIHTYEKNLQEPIISRIKILAHLDIAEKRLPQDGAMRMTIDKKDIDIRVSIFPCSYGENVVMRILDKSQALKKLTDLGMSDEVYGAMNKIIQKPHGIILVSGPTGSGKTTTLYAAINAINTVERNIMTIEDPIEYNIPLIRQTQVNARIGLTFAAGLRSLLRQDPDVMLVGEIRDKETAEIAIQAALTGHLVFATIHTNDAPGAVTRLFDMGIEPFLIANSLVGVLAQRLVRVLCPKCKEKYKPTDDEFVRLGLKEAQEFFRAAGCAACNDTGFTGRVGVYELFVPDAQMRSRIIQSVSAEDLRSDAAARGMKGLRDDGIVKAIRGITSIDDVIRVITQEE